MNIRPKKFKFISITAAVLLAGSVLAFTLLPPKGYVPVLMYHFVLRDQDRPDNALYVRIKDLRSQMWFLKTFGFHPISMQEYEAIKKGEHEAKGREVLVTFDDGHMSYLQYALPVLEEFQIPSVNFLIWDHLMLGREIGGMTLEEVQKLKSHPLIKFEAHSITHTPLVDLSLEQAKFEIEESRHRLEKVLGQPVDYFCYPAGLLNQDLIRLVHDAGYRLAFTTSPKHLNGFPETLWSLTRYKISYRDNFPVFWYKISGLPIFVRAIKHWFAPSD